MPDFTGDAYNIPCRALRGGGTCAPAAGEPGGRSLRGDAQQVLAHGLTSCLLLSLFSLCHPVPRDAAVPC